MVIHLRIRDTKYNGIHDAPRCNGNLGIYHSHYKMTDDIELVTCKKCLKGMK